MRRSGAGRIAAALALALAAAACEDDATGPDAVEGRRIYGVDTENRLVLFGAASAGTPRRTAITGLAAGERVLGVDFRPVDGQLYALGSTSRVYRVDTATAAATPVGVPFTPALSGTAAGWDFNPVPDRIRAHTTGAQNLRIVPATGAMGAVDTALVYVAGDANAGQTPRIVATGYTNSVAGAATTTLYAIDAGRDVLVTLPAPNSGRMQTVGPLGVDATDDAGLDVDPAGGTAYAALTTGGTTRLYTIDLGTGAATAVGALRGAPLRGIAVAP